MKKNAFRVLVYLIESGLVISTASSSASAISTAACANRNSAHQEQAFGSSTQSVQQPRLTLAPAAASPRPALVRPAVEEPIS